MRLALYEAHIDQVTVPRPSAAHSTLWSTTFDAACQAFWLALLLTQGVEVAESVVATAIESIPCEELSRSTLMFEVARISWAGSRTINLSGLDVLKAALILPLELQKVLELPDNSRYCFCLRALAGISAAACSQLMSLQPEEVDRLFETSLRTLAADDHLSSAAFTSFVS